MSNQILLASFYESNPLVEKLQKEVKKLEPLESLNDTFKDIELITDLSRSQGMRAMTSYYDKTDNSFLKDLLCMISGINENTDILYMSFLLKPRFYSDAFCGIEYIKAFLYHEAMLQIVSGESFLFIKIRLNSILNNDVRIKDMD